MRLRASALVVALSLALGSCAHGPPKFDPAARRTCLVLSIGGPRGVAHLGAIAAAREAGLHVDCVVGNSMGSLVGALYAAAPAQDTEALFRRFSDAYVAETKSDAAKNGAIGAAVGSALGAAVGALVGGKDASKQAAAAGAGAILGAGGAHYFDSSLSTRVSRRLTRGSS